MFQEFLFYKKWVKSEQWEGRCFHGWCAAHGAELPCCAGQIPHHGVLLLALLPAHTVVILQFHLHQNLGFLDVFAWLNSGCESQVLCVLPGACQRPLPSFERLNKYSCLTKTACLELFRLTGREGEASMWSPAVYHRAPAPMRGWGTALQSLCMVQKGKKSSYSILDTVLGVFCSMTVTVHGEPRTVYIMWLLGLIT